MSRRTPVPKRPCAICRHQLALHERIYSTYSGMYYCADFTACRRRAKRASR